MSHSPRTPAVAAVTEPARAQRLLLHPLRVRILEAAREEAVSASELGRRLGVPRQKVTYHVRELERAGFLHPAAPEDAARHPREHRVVAAARSWVLLPEVLGPVRAEAAAAGDALSAGHLLALTAEVQSEVERSWAAARDSGARLPTLTMDAEVVLEHGARRAEFADALRAAVAGVIARFAKPDTPGARPWRLVLGVYPRPEEPAHAGH